MENLVNTKTLEQQRQVENRKSAGYTKKKQSEWVKSWKPGGYIDNNSICKWV